MVVWRVENEYGEGPYHSSEGLRTMKQWQERPHTPENGCPGPYEDGFTEKAIDMMIRRKVSCGFRSERQLKDWFTPFELTMLATFGFKPKKVLAKKVFLGRHQIMFVRASSDGGILAENSTPDRIAQASAQA